MPRFIILCVTICALTGCAKNPPPDSPPKPNIIFILADDLGYADLGCYGATDIKTPNLDRLRAQGVKFTNFYSNGPVCTPTRCALMTGRYQQRIGGLEWAIFPGQRAMGLPDPEKSIADLLKSAGYSTAMSGKWHLGYDKHFRPTSHGFDRYFGLLSGNHHYFTHRENNNQPDLYLGDKAIEMEGYSTHLITNHALKFLDEMKSGQRKEKPFFLYVAYNAPHFPYHGPNDRHITFTAQGEWGQKGSRQIYAAMVEEMDKGIGQILDSLDAANLTSNTLVVFKSDNGGTTYSNNGPLNNKKGTLWEGGIRVPCIARLPGVFSPNTESNQVGITMHWTATIAALAKVPAPENRPFDGIDLLSPTAGETRTLFWRRLDPKEVKTHRAVRHGEWKFIDTPDNQQFLYNLSSDLGEKTNLASKNSDLCSSLKHLIDTWESNISSPLYPQSGRQVP